MSHIFLCIFIIFSSLCPCQQWKWCGGNSKALNIYEHCLAHATCMRLCAAATRGGRSSSICYRTDGYMMVMVKKFVENFMNSVCSILNNVDDQSHSTWVMTNDSQCRACWQQCWWRIAISISFIYMEILEQRVPSWLRLAAFIMGPHSLCRTTTCMMKWIVLETT
jgi:hypothetical protein